MDDPNDNEGVTSQAINNPNWNCAGPCPAVNCDSGCAYVNMHCPPAAYPGSGLGSAGSGIRVVIPTTYENQGFEGGDVSVMVPNTFYTWDDARTVTSSFWYKGTCGTANCSFDVMAQFCPRTARVTRAAVGATARPRWARPSRSGRP